MADNTELNKAPAQIDIEHNIAFSERKSLRNSIFALSGILVLMLVMLYVLVQANTTIFPRHQIVYTTNAESVCAFNPVAERGAVTGALVENFAANVARELHLLDYVNFRSTLSRVMDVNFTPEARADTTRAMLESGILRTVTTEGFVIRALPDDRPIILQEGVSFHTSQGVEQATYTWVIRVPVVLAYAYRGLENRPTYRPENRDIYMTIIRTEPSAANPLGLLVARLVSLQPTEEFDISSMTTSLTVNTTN